MPDIGHLGVSLRITMVVVPVGLYFLILGLLNSRPVPQLLRGRRDFALLIGALCPLFLLPLLSWIANVYAALGVLVAAWAGGMLVLAPPRASWVIYNITPGEAAQAVADALRAAGLDFRREDNGFRMVRSEAAVALSSFPLLRNVSIRMTNAGAELERRFESALADRVGRIPAETAPMTVALLLVATAMLVTPLALVAPRADEIVRILTGMLY